MQEDLPVTPEHTTAHNEHSPVFFGPYGLRAGWSIVIAIVMLVVFFKCMNGVLQATHLVSPHTMEHAPGPLPVFVLEVSGFLVAALVTWVMAKIEDRPISIYGLGDDKKIVRLLSGAITGLAAISLLVFFLLKANLLVIDRRLLFGGDAFRYALLWIPGFLAIGFFEEYLFRGFLQYTLARGLAGLAPRISAKIDPRAFGFWAAAALISFGFGAVHGSNPGESPAGLICAGLASLLFCFSLWRTGSLWWAIGLHAAWDYGQSFLFGVADSGTFVGHRLLATHPVGTPLLSGGATGPEGSVYCLPVLALLALLVHFTQPRNASDYATKMPLPPPASSAEDGTALAN
ncbi:MAG: CPBP family intramembrane metalloprotease [Acidobacteria bacterium]|nr:CPBP family intramembrane metalloprotease [Acidobacteriota bacterium]